MDTKAKHLLLRFVRGDMPLLYGISVIVSSHMPTNVNIALGYETSVLPDETRGRDGLGPFFLS